MPSAVAETDAFLGSMQKEAHEDLLGDVLSRGFIAVKEVKGDRVTAPQPINRRGFSGLAPLAYRPMPIVVCTESRPPKLFYAGEEFAPATSDRFSHQGAAHPKG